MSEDDRSLSVLTVVGARPQFIKAFPVSRALEDRHREILVHTGQHYDESLSDVFFRELRISRPAYELGIGSGSAAEQVGQMMQALEPVIASESPDIVLTYGDTNSTLAAALVAAKQSVLLAHVEAGLRSDNWAMPEESNRVLTDHASDILFAPTTRAYDRLHEEGISSGVYFTGDVMVDALEWASSGPIERADVLDRLGLVPDEYVLATVHRAANTDDADRLRSICRGLERLERPVVFPAHPRTIERLREIGRLSQLRERVTVIDPVGYVDFLRLIRDASRVITDSGGVQKEAFLLRTPCVTLRSETEWPETLTRGWNTLVDVDLTRLQRAVDAPVPDAPQSSPFGSGDAADNIVETLTRTVQGGAGTRRRKTRAVPSLYSHLPG